MLDEGSHGDARIRQEQGVSDDHRLFVCRHCYLVCSDGMRDSICLTRDHMEMLGLVTRARGK